jgi:site-specific recombinase XerD
MKATALSESVIRFTITQEKGRVTAVSTNSPGVNHFLDFLQMSRAYNTWVSYAHDLQIFFQVILKPLEAITRADCLTFMQQQDTAGCSGATINRRLAAVSALFHELQLCDPVTYPQNPVSPRPNRRLARSRSPSLYRRQAQPIPEVLSEKDLHAFLEALRSWRDRTLVMLMWISCLRVSEVVSIRFQDIECSRRSIHLLSAKGNHARLVFMSPLTFTALNHYLDQERQQLFPDVEQVFVAFKGRTRGQPLTVNAVQKMIYYYAGQCDLSQVHAHLFRHTGITQLVEQGMPEPALRDLVGHRSPDSLLPYLHLCDKFVETEFERAQAALSSSVWLEELGSGGGR